MDAKILTQPPIHLSARLNFREKKDKILTCFYCWIIENFVINKSLLVGVVTSHLILLYELMGHLKCYKFQQWENYVTFQQKTLLDQHQQKPNKVIPEDSYYSDWFLTIIVKNSLWIHFCFWCYPKFALCLFVFYFRWKHMFQFTTSGIFSFFKKSIFSVQFISITTQLLHGVVLVSLLLTLNIFQTLPLCFYC